jgi:RNA polymerase sigma factor (sigma-70 family)
LSANGPRRRARDDEKGKANAKQNTAVYPLAGRDRLGRNVEADLSPDDQVGQWDLCRKVAQWAVARRRRMGQNYFRTEDFADDLAGDLFLELPAELAAFDASRGVPLRKFLWQQLAWRAQRHVRDEVKWGAHTSEYADDVLLPSEGQGSRKLPGGRSVAIPPREVLTGITPQESTRERLHGALGRIGRQDQILLLAYSRGHTQAELSEMTGLSQSQVSRRIGAALKKLREMLGETHK